MRYAIVSDLHGNLQAWRAVLRDIAGAGAGADRILCLGDVVGYGPNPAEVMESVYAEAHRIVLGNHDAALCGRMDTSRFNDEARQILDWTRSRVSADAVKLAATWPLQLQGRGFRCAHATFDAPARFGYVEEAEDAAASWAAVPDPLLFVGHTHRPAVFVLGASGTPHLIEAQDFVVEPGKRFLVNVGSVGQPRDGDPRASYAIHDSESGAVFFRRVPFDLDACRAAIEAAGLPPVASVFLDADPLRGRRPLREIVSFRPPETAAEGARGAVEIEDLDVLRGRVRRWKAVTAALAGLLLAGALVAGWFAWRRASQAAEFIPAWLPTLVAADRPAGANLLSAPAAGAPPLDGWIVRLGDCRAQEISAMPPTGDGLPAFVLTSRSALETVEIVSAPIVVVPGQRIALEAVFDKDVGFEGTVTLGATLRRAAGGLEERVENFVVKEPNLRRRDGLAARETVEIPAGARELRVRISGRFRGSVRVLAVSASRK
jgi:diadenosine tetraphosphatase ApaH/serine/threonine PP2A family protein phosphatase